jgi:hypothetical protein
MVYDLSWKHRRDIAGPKLDLYCSIFYMKTMLTSVAFRKHPCKMVNLFKIRRHQVFRSDREERKKGGVRTLVRNNINVSETKQYMEEAVDFGRECEESSSCCFFLC